MELFILVILFAVCCLAYITLNKAFQEKYAEKHELYSLITGISIALLGTGIFWIL